MTSEEECGEVGRLRPIVGPSSPMQSLWITLQDYFLLSVCLSRYSYTVQSYLSQMYSEGKAEHTIPVIEDPPTIAGGAERYYGPNAPEDSERPRAPACTALLVLRSDFSEQRHLWTGHKAIDN